MFKRSVGVLCLLFLFAGVAMAIDPVWSFQYDGSKLPEANGFTRVLYNTPGITITTNGPAAGRGVRVDSTAGDVVFLFSNVPSLSLALGATAELTCAVSGSVNGDCGFQVGFANRAIQIQIYPSRIVATNGDQSSLWVEVPTADNGAGTIWRFTIDSGANIRIYRNGVLVIGPVLVPSIISNQNPDFMWWCESGAICNVTTVKFYLGGPVAP